MAHRHGEVVVGAAAIILDGRARVLLTKRGNEPRKGYWHLPGGAVEFGERWAATVVREIREELGVEIALERSVPNHVTEDIIAAEGRHVVCAHFTARIAAGELAALDGTDAFAWFTEEEARALELLLPSSIDALRVVLGWRF